MQVSVPISQKCFCLGAYLSPPLCLPHLPDVDFIVQTTSQVYVVGFVAAVVIHLLFSVSLTRI